MTPDPSSSSDAKQPQSWNQYAYSYGDPVNNLDPSGLDPCGSSYSVNSNGVISVTVFDCSGFTGGPGSSSTAQSGSSGKAQHAAPPATPGLGVAQDLSIINAITFEASDTVVDPDCARLFLAPDSNTPANRAALGNMLAGLADSGTIRLLSGSNTPANIPAFTTDTLGLIYIVQGGSFFTGKYNGQPLGGAFSGLSLSQDQQLIIIHEFMHYMGIVGPDNDNQTYTLPDGEVVKGSQGISNAVRKDCFK